MKMIKLVSLLFLLLITFHQNVYSQVDDVIAIKSELYKWRDAFNQKDLQNTMSVYAENYIGFYPGLAALDIKAMKEQYEKLKKIYENGGSLADAGLAPKDPVEELKELMQKYNALKAQLKNLAPGTPAYEKMKQDALAVYKEYTEKHDKAKKEGLVT